jgi:hypothetical protein
MALMPGEVNRKTFFIIGLIILIFAIIGLITCFALPWFEIETDGDQETYYYGDFGQDFEENAGNEMDEYYHGSANLALIGFGLLVLISILLILEGWRGFVSGFLTRRIFNISPEQDPALSSRVTIVLISLLILIPLAVGVIGGTRFIGVTSAMQASADSFKMDGQTFDSEYGSPAGLSVTVIGFIIFAICIYFILKNVSDLNVSEDTNYERWEYSKKLSKFALILVIISFIGLVTVPILSFMEWEYKQEIDLGPTAEEYVGDYSSGDIEYKSFFNDGLIHVWGQTGSGGKIDDIMEDIDWNITLIAWALALMLIISILVIFGIMFYNLGRFPKGAHLLITLGILSFLIAIIIFIGYGLVAMCVGEIDSEFEESLVDSGGGSFEGSGTVSIEWNAHMGVNFIPLIMGIIILSIFFLYIRNIWPVSMAVVLGKRAPEAEPGAAIPGAVPEPTAEGAPGAKPQPTPARERVPGKPIPRNVLAAIIIVIIIVLAGIGGAFLLISGGDSKGKKDNKPSEPVNLAEVTSSQMETGYTAENQDSTVQFNLDEPRLKWINCSLYWNDEPSQYVLGINDPDSFKIAVIAPNGETVAESQFSTSGMVDTTTEIDYTASNYEEDYVGVWTIVVSAGDCGNDKSRFGFRETSDDGNEWVLDCLITYMIPYEDVEQPEEENGSYLLFYSTFVMPKLN